VIVEINASGPCSVTAIVDGRVVGERLLSAGERQTFEATGDLRLKIGDAAAISWTVNGQPARPLGRAGQVVNLHLTPANAAEYVTNR
jgi:hypothetical protein